MSNQERYLLVELIKCHEALVKIYSKMVACDEIDRKLWADLAERQESQVESIHQNLCDIQDGVKY